MKRISLSSPTLDLGLLLLLFTGFGCATANVQAGSTPMMQAQQEMNVDLLLDIQIQPFDSGLAEVMEEGTEGMEVFADVRRAESRFLPYHLKTVLEESGHWGAVRLSPMSASPGEVTIEGDILQSDGESLDVDVRVTDATGRTWISRRYRGEVTVSTYLEIEENRLTHDPFQDFYNRIANDMLVYRNGLDEEEVQAIRKVASLRFAADLAPDAFSEHLKHDSDGQYEINRLPAPDDTMMARIERARVRDAVLVDALNEHYGQFYVGMSDSYRDWRAYNYLEVIALRELKRDATIRMAAGAAAFIGGITLATMGLPVALEMLAAPLLMGGSMAVRSGLGMYEESGIHAEAIRELGQTFESEVSPRVVELEGRAVHLTGSAETQYENWRRVLRLIYANEMGLPTEIDLPTEADANTSPEPHVSAQ